MITDTLPQAGTDFMNPITANLFNAPAYFSGDTPLSAIERAFSVWAASLAPQQLPDATAREAAAQAARDCPEGFETVTINGKPRLRCRGRGMATPGGQTQSPNVVTGPDTQGEWHAPMVEGQTEGTLTAPLTPAEEAAIRAYQQPKIVCDYLDLACHAENFFNSSTGKRLGDTAVDWGKRIGLIVAAIVLIAVAVISLKEG
jgi:hypothetical protein